jgi:hypothetical protein
MRPNFVTQEDSTELDRERIYARPFFPTPSLSATVRFECLPPFGRSHDIKLRGIPRLT